MRSNVGVAEDPALSASSETAGVSGPTPRMYARVQGWLMSGLALRLLSLVVVLGLWQLIGTGHPYSITTPSAIARAAVNDMTSLVLPAFGTTLRSLLLGYVISAAIGVPVGILMGMSRWADWALRPYTSALYATPRVALIPILMLWVGIGYELQLVTALMFGIFPIIVNVYTGVKEVRREYIEVGVSLTASRPRILRTIIIPGSLHYMFVGLRLGLAWATIGTVVAEIEVGTSGVGSLLSTFAQELHVAEVWVPLILLGLFSICCATLMKWAERWASMPWTRGQWMVRWRSTH